MGKTKPEDDNESTAHEAAEQSDENIVAISQACFKRADLVRRPRRQKNDENWRAYFGEQDWSHKADHQSQETTPSFPIACEQVVGTFERALTDSDDWLAAEPPAYGLKPILPADAIEGVVKFYCTRLHRPGRRPESSYGIQVLVGDAIKQGILEPSVVFKVYPVLIKDRIYRLAVQKPEASGEYAAYRLAKSPKKTLKPEIVERMRLRIDLVNWDDYFPDPSEHRRWEIQRVRVHVSELLDNPEYDQDAVKALIGKANQTRVENDRRRNSGEQVVGGDPYEIELFEGWGDIIGEEGEVLHENVFWAWAGDQLLRKPTPNPFWDGTSPFIDTELIRTPNSQETKALADHAVPMWRVSNELVNLLLDGSFRAAWGVGQVRPDLMEAPEEIAGGVPQGYTAVLRPNVPQGQKFYERVDNGEVPALSIDGLNRVEQYTNEALAMPDTKLGQVSQRAVKATEVVQAMQSSGSLYESLAARFEDTGLEPVFEKAWKVILQYATDFVEEELVAALGAKNALILSDMSPAERFKLLHRTSFRVRGLRAVANRERQFQKLMTLVNILQTNPQFADHFGKKRSFDKLWDMVIQTIGIDPRMLDISVEDMQAGAAQNGLDGSAGGQLNPSLGTGSGASQPNITTTVAAQRGEQSALAPNNPAAGGQPG